MPLLKFEQPLRMLRSNYDLTKNWYWFSSKMYEGEL